MSIQTPYNSIAFVGNNLTNIYSFTYPVFQASDLVVTVLSPQGQSYLLSQGQDYTVGGLNPSGGMPSTGSITLVNNYQSWLTTGLTPGYLLIGWTITITRVVQLIQSTSLRNQGNFFPMTIENMADYLMMAIQQVASEVGAISPATPSLNIVDQFNGHTYQLQVQNGILGLVQIS